MKQNKDALISRASLFIYRRMYLDNPDIFRLIHAVELFTNEIIVRWVNAFDHNIGISPVLVLGELNKKGPQKQLLWLKN